MAITPKCDACGKELNEFGAILLSPPKENLTVKYHICINCYDRLVKFLSINHK